ncbi:MAG TPA: hypothetical protein VG756_09255 [Pseudonocardiaceae bacterium]|nr:hypothetical protein [Pseudonocardiaceae bacterium]
MSTGLPFDRFVPLGEILALPGDQPIQFHAARSDVPRRGDEATELADDA